MAHGQLGCLVSSQGGAHVADPGEYSRWDSVCLLLCTITGKSVSIGSLDIGKSLRIPAPYGVLISHPGFLDASLNWVFRRGLVIGIQGFSHLNTLFIALEKPVSQILFPLDFSFRGKVVQNETITVGSNMFTQCSNRKD